MVFVTGFIIVLRRLHEKQQFCLFDIEKHNLPAHRFGDDVQVCICVNRKLQFII